MKRTISVAMGATAIALVAAACGGGGGSTNQSQGAQGAQGTQGGSNASSAAKPTSGPATVNVTDHKGVKILVDSAGRTLYLFEADKGTTSTCYDTCASFWPPMTTKGTPQAKGGAVASKIGTTKRKDGTLQVTYAGHPLYTYAGDKRPGDTTGQDIDQFGGEWYVLVPKGSAYEGEFG